MIKWIENQCIYRCMMYNSVEQLYVFNFLSNLSFTLSLCICFCEFVVEQSITCLCLLAKAKLFFTIKHRATCLTWLHACQICSKWEMWILDRRLIHSWRSSRFIDPHCFGRCQPVRCVVVLNFGHVEIIYFFSVGFFDYLQIDVGHGRIFWFR